MHALFLKILHLAFLLQLSMHPLTHFTRETLGGWERAVESHPITLIPYTIRTHPDQPPPYTFSHQEHQEHQETAQFCSSIFTTFHCSNHFPSFTKVVPKASIYLRNQLSSPFHHHSTTFQAPQLGIRQEHKIPETWRRRSLEGKRSLRGGCHLHLESPRSCWPSSLENFLTLLLLFFVSMFPFLTILMYSLNMCE